MPYVFSSVRPAAPLAARLAASASAVPGSVTLAYAVSPGGGFNFMAGFVARRVGGGARPWLAFGYAPVGVGPVLGSYASRLAAFGAVCAAFASLPGGPSV